MKIEDGVIVEATEKELFDVWLQQWSNIMGFPEYVRRIVELGGTRIIEQE